MMGGRHVRGRHSPKTAREKTDSAPLEPTPSPNEEQQEQTPQEAVTAEKPKTQNPLLRDLLLLGFKILMLGVIFGIIFLVIFGIARSADVSMSPAVKDGDLVLYYRLDKDYRQGDVVVLDVNGETQIRRVVAVAGDTVDVTEEGLVVNGALQQESGIYEETHRYEEGIAFPVTLKEGEVFLLGDGRGHSTDSRIYGPVNSRDIKGKAITVIRRRGI